MSALRLRWLGAAVAGGVLVVGLLLGGCVGAKAVDDAVNGNAPSDSQDPAQAGQSGQVAPPEISPAPGSFVDSVQVELACATDGAAIYYTLDGGEPDESARQYSTPLVLTDSTLVKARAYAAGLAASEVCSASFLREDTRTFDVEWRDGTTVIGEDQLELLTDIDAAADVYTFDADAVAAAGLDFIVGDILIIYRRELGRISAVTAGDGVVRVQTEPAVLTDAIENGTIRWNVGVPLTAATVYELDAEYLAVKSAQTAKAVARTLDIPFKYGDYSGNMKITFPPDPPEGQVAAAAAVVELTLTKSLKPTGEAKLVATGNLYRFRDVGDIQVADGKLTRFEHACQHLKGDLTLELIVAGSTREFEGLQNFPLIKAPLGVLGPVLFELELGVSAIVSGTVPLEGSAHVRTRFEYDTDMGVSFDGIELGGQAEVAGYEIDAEGGEHHVAGPSQAGINFGLGFPHIELGAETLLAEAAAWAHPAYLIGGSFTVDQALVPTCMRIEAQFIGAGGAKVSALGGLLEADGNVEFFSKKKTLVESGDCKDE